MTLTAKQPGPAGDYPLSGGNDVGEDPYGPFGTHEPWDRPHLRICGGISREGDLINCRTISFVPVSRLGDTWKAANNALEQKQRQKLSACTRQIYNIDLRTFVPMAPGSNGYFYGVNTNGQGITVETDVTHSSWYLGLAIFPQTGPDAGRTPLSTAFSQLNYAASDQLFMAPGIIQPTQIHELGHSLDMITSGSIYGSNEVSANRLLNCVNNP